MAGGGSRRRVRRGRERSPSGYAARKSGRRPASGRSRSRSCTESCGRRATRAARDRCGGTWHGACRCRGSGRGGVSRCGRGSRVRWTGSSGGCGSTTRAASGGAWRLDRQHLAPLPASLPLDLPLVGRRPDPRRIDHRPDLLFYDGPGDGRVAPATPLGQLGREIVLEKSWEVDDPARRGIGVYEAALGGAA